MVAFLKVYVKLQKRECNLRKVDDSWNGILYCMQHPFCKIGMDMRLLRYRLSSSSLNRYHTSYETHGRHGLCERYTMEQVGLKCHTQNENKKKSLLASEKGNFSTKLFRRNESGSKRNAKQKRNLMKSELSFFNLDETKIVVFEGFGSSIAPTWSHEVRP